MHLSTSNALKAISLLGAASSVDAFWRMPCMSRSGVARIDPLVSFGTISEHAHVIHGSSGFSDTATHADLLAGECTSCEVAQDKSAYWTPGIYFKNAATGHFQLVQQVGGMLAYYLLYPNAGNKTVSAFPAGFQMIAGDTNQRNFSYPVPDIPKSNWSGNMTEQAFLRQAALGFNCLNYAMPPEGSLYRHFLPDKAYLDANCLDGVRFELMFPSCWNGELDSPDHRSHVAYPSEVMTGNCPPGFDTRLVSLFYETIWNTYEFVGVDGEFVLSNGDPTGYGYHGDFIMGWDEAFLQQAVDTCTNLSGQIQDCPLFNIQASSAYSNCNFTMPPALISDNVVGPIPSLPGNQLIGSGPAYANGAMAGGPGSTPPPPTVGVDPPANPVPTLSHSDGSTLASAATYVPGAVFQEVAGASAPGTTPAPIVPVGPIPIFFSTGYTTSGQVVEEVLWVEEVVTVTATVAGRRRGVHLHKHRRGDF